MLSTSRPAKISNLEEFTRLVELGQIEMANDILENAMASEEDGMSWATALRTLCDSQPDSALPYGVDMAPLLHIIGVPTIGHATDVPPAELLLEALKYVRNIDNDELLRHAADNADVIEPYDEYENDETWDINHDIVGALFVENTESDTSDQLRIGAYGYAYIDWLPGVTGYNTETGTLSNFRVILKPHASLPNIFYGGLNHIHARILEAHVVNGGLSEIKLWPNKLGEPLLMEYACTCR